MRVILLEKVANLGKVGDQVKVKPGFGRNYLIPGAKAIRATPDNIAAFETRRADLEKAAEQAVAQAEKRRESLEALKVVISAQAGDEGKLFGSVGPRDVAEAITAAGVEVAKREIDLSAGPLRTIGEHEVAVHLHSDVVAKVQVEVVPL